jgi:hypothetical protein
MRRERRAEAFIDERETDADLAPAKITMVRGRTNA